MPTIARRLPNASLADWQQNKPTARMARAHMERVLRCAPPGWQAAIRAQLQPGHPNAHHAPQSAADFLASPPDWAVAWDLLQAIASFEDQQGPALRWNLDDADICKMANKLAAEADELDAVTLANGGDLAARIDAIRMLVRCVGIAEDKPIQGEPGIRRAQDAGWWRRRLRVHVRRTVEAGGIAFGMVHKASGGYVSQSGLQRREQQLKRNAEVLERSLYRNEAGQVFNLREVAAQGVANPTIRGGELMTRIRGAEEYADARGHVGLFLTMTLPSRFHAMKLGSGGRPFKNPRYGGATPVEGQRWLRDQWARTRAALARQGVRMYGLRVAEPHHDATPHWHAVLWAENETDAQAIEAQVRRYWLSDDGDEPGAAENRVHIKRLLKGGAAGYVAKYIAKSVGHHALAEHMDVVDSQKVPLDAAEPGQGYHRVDAWAAHWSIRQFQAIGLPSVTVWRELRRVTKDQLELFQREGDRPTLRAYQACHRHGTLRADWRLYMEAMGGHALPRHQWHLTTVRGSFEPGDVNKYGEAIKTGRIFGVVPLRGRMCGRPLVSRRMLWTAVHGDEAQARRMARGPLPAAWTGFNNCTARITGNLCQLLFGRGPHQIEDWATPEVVEFFRIERYKTMLPLPRPEPAVVTESGWDW